MDWPREVHTEKAVLQVSWAQRSLFSGPLKECTGNGSGQRDWYCEAVQGDGRMQNADACYTAVYSKCFQPCPLLCTSVPVNAKCQDSVTFENKSQLEVQRDMIDEPVKKQPGQRNLEAYQNSCSWKRKLVLLNMEKFLSAMLLCKRICLCTCACRNLSAYQN